MYWYQCEPHKPWKLITDPKTIEPLPDILGYLMTEFLAYSPKNIERRKVLHEAARLRYGLRANPGDPKLVGLTEDMIMGADYEGLRRLIDRYK